MKNQEFNFDPKESGEPCLVKLQLFEGPLDLLLHLIKKNEVDIYDIPVAKITEQYLEYLDFMKELNLHVVGEYLVIAAELGLIKSRMLLPKSVVEEEEGEDPRAELVRRLVEYQRYKEAADDLWTTDILGRDVHKREINEADRMVNEEVEMLPVDLWALIEAFRDFYERRSEAWKNDISYTVEHISVEDKMAELIYKLKSRENMSFQDVINDCETKLEYVVCFLALLELIRSDSVQVYQEGPYGMIQLSYTGE